MSAKKSGASAPAHSPSVLVPSQAAPDAVQWLPLLTNYGQSAVAAGREPNFEGTLLVSSARRIAKIPADQAELAAPLAREGLGAGFFSAVGEVGEELHAAANAVPPDRRHIELLPPAQKAAVAEVLRHILQARKMAFTVALATGRTEEARALGRGLKVGASLESIRAAVRTFVTGAAERQALLADAGVTPARLARLNEDLVRLDAVETEKAERQQDKDQSSAQINTLSLALEASFGFLRARAEGAFEDAPLQLEATLRYLPRAPERRSQASTDPAKKAAREEKKEARRAAKEAKREAREARREARKEAKEGAPEQPAAQASAPLAQADGAAPAPAAAAAAK